MTLAGLAHAESYGNRPSVCGNFTPEGLQGYQVPGRKPDSQMPWELFLGNAAHRLIAYIYGTRYPTNVAFYNKETIKLILDRAGIGDSSLLPENERDMRPDITDASTREVFEIKPHNERGLQEGTRQLQTYVLVLNRTLTPGNEFSGGKKFEGEVLIQFAQGQHIWRLEWCTTRPGVTQYRWSRSQERLDSNAVAYQVGQWVEISERELKQYGGWVAQAIEGMVDRRERLASLREAIGTAIKIAGGVALVVVSAGMSGERGAVRPEGKLLPFPSKPLPTVPQVQLPKASGM